MTKMRTISRLKNFWSDTFSCSRKVKRTAEFGAYNRDAVVLLVTGANASVDYFVKGYLQNQNKSYIEVNSLCETDAIFAIQRSQVVVIVRYLPVKLVGALRKFKQHGGQIIYFMDDDLMDQTALSGLPRAYAKKIKTMALGARQVIEEICDEFWVSTSFLAEKYNHWNPITLAPRPRFKKVEKIDSLAVCYHGSASHQAELLWLVDVVARTNSKLHNTFFEVFGDISVNRIYRNVPRCAVLHPMSWPNYLAFSELVKRDIALAPLLPGLFNLGRGPTKFFDFTRMGAVGLYSNVEPYRGFIRHGIDGFLLENNPEDWVNAIVKLASEPELRRNIVAAAEARTKALSETFLPIA